MPFGYYRDSPNGINQMVGTSAEIGAGKANTEKLVEAMGERAYLEESGDKKGIYAAKIASMMGAEGAEWYLPSSEEFELIEGYYGWTSTESGTTQAYEKSHIIMNSARADKKTIYLIHYF